MKLSKKLAFLGAAALLATAVFVGCTSEDEEDAFSGDKFSYNWDTTKAGDAWYYRSFKATATKHYSANAVITINGCETLNTGVKDNNGKDFVAPCATGFVFDLDKIADKVQTYKDGKEDAKVQLYNFAIASVRYNTSKKSVQWYVNYVTNCPETAFNYNTESSFKGTLTISAEGQTKDYGDEVYVAPAGVNGWEDVAAANESYSNGTLKVMIKTVANDDGSYTVQLCNSNGTVTYKEATISAGTTGLDKKTQKYIGRYLTVYKGQSASGSVEYKDVSGMAIPADYE